MTIVLRERFVPADVHGEGIAERKKGLNLFTFVVSLEQENLIIEAVKGVENSTICRLRMVFLYSPW